MLEKASPYKLMISFQTPEDFIPKFANILSRRNSSAPAPSALLRAGRARLQKNCLSSVGEPADPYGS
jgi:hypothetical protein